MLPKDLVSFISINFISTNRILSFQDLQSIATGLSDIQKIEVFDIKPTFKILKMTFRQHYDGNGLAKIQFRTVIFVPVTLTEQ